MNEMWACRIGETVLISKKNSDRILSNTLSFTKFSARKFWTGQAL